jgi:hypothetical protein
MSQVRSTFLRQLIAADAAACGLGGAVFALDAPALAAPFGLSPALLQPVGVFLIGYAALLAWLATRPALPRAVVWALVSVNVLWAAESAMLVLLGWTHPSALGTAVVLGQAAAAVMVAELQFLVLKRAKATA